MKYMNACRVVICLGALLVASCSSGDPKGAGGEGGQAGAGGQTSTSQTGGAGSGGATSQGGGGGSSDPYEQYRAACVDKINAYRATKGLPALERWKDAESCLDQQAAEDAMTGQAHGAWLSGKYPCNGVGQNECPGWGASGIESCLDSMWSEKDQPGCSGCDMCNDSYNPDCPNCDFYGQKSGDVCGHYANMIAKYVTKVGCGFSEGGWDVINFQ